MRCCCACVCIGTWALLTHPTPRVTDHERAVRVSALQQERWWGCCACAGIGTWTLLTHPTPPVTDHERAVPVSAQQQERWWGCCACVCIGTWTLSSHPPHPTPWRDYQCWSFRLYGALMVPPPQPKGLNPLEGFLSVDHLPCNVCLWWGSRSDASVPMGKWKIDSPSTPKSAFCVGSELILVLGVRSWCWEWVGVGSELIFGVGSELLTCWWWWWLWPIRKVCRRRILGRGWPSLRLCWHLVDQLGAMLAHLHAGC